MSDLPVPTYMEPQWFFPMFAVMWFGITGLLAHVGGWASLASTFRATQPAIGERFRFVSGSMGAKFFPVSYGGCLFFAVSDTGIHLSILFPFRFLSPPLFIPWSQVESVTPKRFLFSRYTSIRVCDQWPTISVRGNASKFINEVYTRASSHGAP
jgi:hypothetical protein